MSGLSTRTHGLPGTYTSGCRCESCTTAWREYARNRASHAAPNLATRRCAQLVQEFAPDLWDRILDDAYAELGAKRPAKKVPA